MASTATLISVIVLIFASLIFLAVKPLFEVPLVPKIEEKWWGPGSPSKDADITPFKINVSDEVLKDLQYRLSDSLPLQEPLEGVKHHYGINTKLLKTVVEFWRTSYKWREQEKFLNKYPQFKVGIQGLNIHYIHVKPEKTNGLRVRPMLLLHGWPGSVREFYEIIPLLTTPQEGRNFVFEVIVPSLPGYGFSDAAVRPGLGPAQVGVVMKNLMQKLGFEKYYLQGGDWGAVIIQQMSVLFPEKLLGVHSNMCGGVTTVLSNLKLFLYSFYPSAIVDKKHEHLVYPMSKIWSYKILESGYMHLQASKPDTVGVALRESPVGLAAYILEKFITWTNPAWKDLDDGGLTRKYTMTKLLDNVMIYWVNRCITTSMRLYSENFSYESRSLNLDKFPVSVPYGCARFCYDITYSPENILKDTYRNLVHVSDYEGGHFAAFEVPDILAQDIYTFVEKVEK